jgi:putative inorganic carbon (HCO3(-)) transporter
VDREPRRPSALALATTAALVTSVFTGYFEWVPGDVPLNRVALFVMMILALASAGYWQLKPSLVHWVLLAQILWVAGSAVWVGTSTDSYAFFAMLDQVMVPSLFFVVGPIAFARARDREILLRGIALVVIYCFYVSVAQAFALGGLIFPRYAAAGLVSGEINRAGGPFLQIAANGSALAMAIPLLLVLFERSAGAWRITAAVAAVMAAAGAFLTLTRSVWIAAVLSIVVAMWFSARLRAWLIPSLLVLAVSLMATLTLVSSVADAVFARFGTERSIDDRTITNAAAVTMVEKYPLTGVGWGRFLSLVDDYVVQPVNGPLTNTHIIAHNIFLSRAAELGLVGAGLLVAALVLGPLRAAVRPRPGIDPAWRHALLASSIAWFVVAMLTPMGYAFSNYLLWLVAGICTTQWQRRPEGRHRSAVTAAVQ